MIELSERARALLNGRHFAVLATINDDGTPHLTTMWYLLEKYNDTDVLVMNTKMGRVKEKNMRSKPYISVCVEYEYSYVNISGKVELIDDPEITQSDIYRLAVRYDGELSAMQQMRKRFSKEIRVSLCLKCEKISEYFSQ